MKVFVKYFARFREALSCSEEEIDVKNNAQLKDLITLLATRKGEWQKIFSASENLLSAINQNIAQPEQDLYEGDEIAFYPPVTGG